MDDHLETAYLAGGCTWIMQAMLDHPGGVVSTRTGFMGGDTADPDDRDCGSHAEVTQVVFDPARLSYRGLLEVFFQVHRADLDADVVGSQYRSEIFCTTSEQRTVAEETIRDVDAAEHWPGRTVTRVSDVAKFWPDPIEAQHYLARFPHGVAPPFPQNAPASASRPAIV
jgi:peptide-methionine (S)-S-oxide reductase